MARIKWDQTGKKTFETGVDHGVLYPMVNGAYPKGVAWNGLITVTESPSGAENTALYADNIKYLNLKSAEEFGATVECYTYPDEWAACDGTKELATGVLVGQQARQSFGLCYRTRIGNDTDGDGHGYKLHLIYNASASPSEKSYGTVSDSPEAITFSYEITTTPVAFTTTGSDGETYQPVASITIDSTKADSTKLKALEEILYGKDGERGTGVDPKLPLPDEIVTLFAAG